MEPKQETYSFTHTDENGTTITLNFTVKSVGTTIFTFHEMCRKFAQACGYAESSINESFGEGWDESFTEFMSE